MHELTIAGFEKAMTASVAVIVATKHVGKLGRPGSLRQDGDQGVTLLEHFACLLITRVLSDKESEEGSAPSNLAGMRAE